MSRLHFALALGTILVTLTATTWAIPTNPDPLHTAAATPWSSVAINVLNPATDQHQHHDTDNLFGVAGKYDTYAVWDDNNFRYNANADRELSKALDGQDYGHGYMLNAATYQYTNNVPAAAKPLFNTNIVAFWENQINGNRLNSNGVKVHTLINFAEVPQPLVTDIIVNFAPQYPKGGAGNIMIEDFPSPGEIDPDGIPAGGGGNGRDGVLAFWTPSIKVLTFNSLINWYYLDPLNGPAAGQFDFVTTALHEFGHILGLDHEGAAGTVMFPRQASYVLNAQNMVVPFDNTTEVRALDANTKDGSIDLYTIAPEPTTVSLLGLSTMAMIRRRR